MIFLFIESFMIHFIYLTTQNNIIKLILYSVSDNNKKEIDFVDITKLYQQKIKKEKITIILCQILFVIVFISMWEILARLEIIDKFLFSCPSDIIKLLIKNIKSFCKD